MAVPTDPDDLASLSSCYCYSSDSGRSVIIYLLANIAGLQAQTPAALAQAAACYCFDQATATKVIAYLLCQAANNATSSGSGVTCGTEDPSAAPTGNCGIYVRTDNGHVWYWDGASWVALVE